MLRLLPFIAPYALYHSAFEKVSSLASVLSSLVGSDHIDLSPFRIVEWGFCHSSLVTLPTMRLHFVFIVIYVAKCSLRWSWVGKLLMSFWLQISRSLISIQGSVRPAHIPLSSQERLKRGQGASRWFIKADAEPLRLHYLDRRNYIDVKNCHKVGCHKRC